MAARRFEIVVGVTLFLLSVGMAWGAAHMPAGTISMPGPGLLPLILALLLAGASLVHTVLCLRVAPDPLDQAQVAQDPATRWQIVIMLAAIAGAAVLFERIGYFPTAALFLFVMFLSLSNLGWWRSALAALAGAGVSLFVFRYVLEVALPQMPVTLPF